MIVTVLRVQCAELESWQMMWSRKSSEHLCKTDNGRWAVLEEPVPRRPCLGCSGVFGLRLM